jgi:hypothetical protein
VSFQGSGKKEVVGTIAEPRKGPLRRVLLRIG